MKLSLVFWATMSVAGLLTELIFQAVGAIPTTLRGDIATTHIGLNYTTVLNVIALAAFGYLYYLDKHAADFGGGQGYAKGVVCGMQVRTADAPACSSYKGTTCYFCSDKCHTKFAANPDKYASGDAATCMDDTDGMEADGGTVVDPVCGMTVDPATAVAHLQHDGHDVSFCSTGCRDRFASDPGVYTTGLRR